MVHNNKILTVSYGTFSCTLEGFDDSFDTMKAIAEYFRDLAADDRYFGAEPPQPDADMLARIAQREITRQVEAHSTDTGTIVLRATMPDAGVIDTAVASPPPVAKSPSEQLPQATPEQVHEPISELVAEPVSIATEAAEQHAEVAEVVEIDVPGSTEPEVEQVHVEKPSPVPELTGDVSEVKPQMVEAAKVDDVVEDVVEAVVEEIATDNADTVTEVTTKDLGAVDDTTEAETQVVAEVVKTPETIPAVDSIAAKLQRIRAVVSQSDSLSQMDDYTEDQHADGFVAAAAEDIAQSLNSNDDAEETPDADDSSDQINRLLDRIDAGNKDQTEDIDSLADDTASLVASTSDTASADEPVTEMMAQEAIKDTIEDSGNDDVPTSDDPYFVGHSPAPHIGAFEEPQSDDNDKPELTTDVTEDDVDARVETGVEAGVEVEPKAPLQARVVKVKRSEISAAIASGKLEQVDSDAGDDDGDDFFDDTGNVPDGSLSPEDEADLMRELANVENELASGDVGADSDAGFEDNIFGEVNTSQDDDDDISDDFGNDFDDDAHVTLQQKVEDDEADLSRLMTEADEKLDDPETSSRHETYSQLRAAVAVAEAERSAGGSIDGGSGDKAYRDDLAEVVRPRRPAIDGARASRPVIEARPAPLKLVAEQRVDTGAGIAQRDPVRPRRVMTTPVGEAGALDATTADSAFAEFAARMGATELPDLLEAAAAYLSFVEGHDKFSRPQLMNKVRLIKQDDFNREDGLRSFGQLLRDGKIKKKGGGRFAASGDIGFQPDGEREAG